MISMVVTGELAASKRGNDEEIFEPAQYPMNEAVFDDATA
jgi:hypothetical protein